MQVQKCVLFLASPDSAYFLHYGSNMYSGLEPEVTPSLRRCRAAAAAHVPCTALPDLHLAGRGCL